MLLVHFTELKAIKSSEIGHTYCGTSALRKVSTALQLTVKFSSGCKLKDEIHTRSIVEVAIETQDVRVPVE